jgi:hypothetical protein
MGPPGVCVCTGEFRVPEINRGMAQVMKACGLKCLLSVYKVAVGQVAQSV